MLRPTIDEGEFVQTCNCYVKCAGVRMATYIIEVKRSVGKLKDWGVVSGWELYYNTRCIGVGCSVLFDIIECGEDVLAEVSAELSKFDKVSYRFKPDQSIFTNAVKAHVQKEEKELNDSRLIR